jgi:hypothetical protein
MQHFTRWQWFEVKQKETNYGMHEETYSTKLFRKQPKLIEYRMIKN